MADKAYRHKGTGVVIAVAADSDLEETVTSSGQYEPAALADLATSVPALGGTAGPGVGERDETNGYLTPPGVPPTPITGPRMAATIPADPLADVLAGTTEEVNAYLDERPEAAAAVLAAEAAGKARKGILEGRHAPTPPAGE